MAVRSSLALVRTWLVLDFFGEARRTGQTGSSLTATIFTQSFVALLLAAVLFDPDIALVPYAAANLSLSTVLIGIAALSDPERVDRRLADRLVVRTAPVGRAVLPLARAVHAGFHLTLVATGMAIPPAILCYWVSDRRLSAVPLYLLCAVVTAGLLAALITVALRAAVRWFGANRAALFAGTAKALLLGGAFAGFVLSFPHLDETVDALPFGRAAVLAWPPYLAARWLAAPLSDAAFGLALLGAAVALFLASVVVGEQEPRRRARVRRRRSWLARLEQRVAGGGPLLGTSAYTSAMLYRSPGFRARVLPLFGVPAAMILLAFGNQDGRAQHLLVGVTLQFPAIYLPFVTMFLTQAEDRGAAWLFDTSPRHSIALAREAALIAISIRLLLPLHLAGALAVIALGFGVLTAGSLALFSWATATFVASLALRSLEHVPFTAPDESETAVDFSHLLGAALVLTALGGGFALLAATPLGLLVGALAAAGATWRLLRPARNASRFQEQSCGTP